MLSGLLSDKSPPPNMAICDFQGQQGKLVVVDGLKKPTIPSLVPIDWYLVMLARGETHWRSK